MARSTTSENVFARYTSFQELDFAYECATSPENLYMDGEISADQARARGKKFDADYIARRNEIVLGK